MRDFAFVLSLARGFSRPEPGAAEIRESVDAKAPQPSRSGERAHREAEALRSAPAERSRAATPRT